MDIGECLKSYAALAVLFLRKRTHNILRRKETKAIGLI
jgi:hypothetical protein